MLYKFFSLGILSRIVPMILQEYLLAFLKYFWKFCQENISSVLSDIHSDFFFQKVVFLQEYFFASSRNSCVSFAILSLVSCRNFFWIFFFERLRKFYEKLFSKLLLHLEFFQNIYIQFFLKLLPSIFWRTGRMQNGISSEISKEFLEEFPVEFKKKIMTKNFEKIFNEIFKMQKESPKMF